VLAETCIGGEIERAVLRPDLAVHVVFVELAEVLPCGIHRVQERHVLRHRDLELADPERVLHRTDRQTLGAVEGAAAQLE